MLRVVSRRVSGVRAFSFGYAINRFSKVVQVEGDTNVFHTTASNELSILGNPNGGQLTFAALSAASKCTSLPDILNIQATFVAPPSSKSESTLTVKPLTKESKTQETCTVSYTQDNKPIAEFFFTFGDMEKNRKFGGFSYPASTAHVPAPESLPSPNDPKLTNYSELLDQKMGKILFIARHHKFMLDPETSTLYQKHAFNKSTDESKLTGWGGYADDKPIELSDLSFLMDAFPPPILAQEPTGWVPTISYSVNFFSKPKTNSSLVQLDFQTRIAKHGVIECDGHAWDVDGELLATSRQMARVWKPK
ncbi:hypothetical protein TrLO_g15357 [Triparma laevis f. longispina]|uniref:Thioesterase-like superfamily-domain-containing protein n=1 Tax=Triparma laevis f. longispina TaxID=1714387 RepID=A0A9W7KSL3_9STRA|nr:hypothetical protein TrLO_g15357 [Triparma laevis f. longispina]